MDPIVDLDEELPVDSDHVDNDNTDNEPTESVVEASMITDTDSEHQGEPDNSPPMTGMMPTQAGVDKTDILKNVVATIRQDGTAITEVGEINPDKPIRLSINFAAPVLGDHPQPEEDQLLCQRAAFYRLFIVFGYLLFALFSYWLSASLQA